jgi:hypothetical protein
MVVQRLHIFTRWLAASAAVVLVVLCSPGPVDAQASAAPNPHDAQPERPTVATHAHTVAPGWVELEAGLQRQGEGALSNRVAVPIVLKVGLGTQVQLDIAPAWQRDAQDGRIQSGITDLLVAVKWRLTDDVPLLGVIAVQTAVSLPTGSANAGRGTGSAGLNLLAISSHEFGRVTIDANVGYTRLGGDGTIAPQNSTLWALAAGLPIAGRLGWDVEVFGFPGTSGPAGARPVVALLTGPTFTIRPYIVLDAGATFDIEGFGRTGVYAGVTWNIGRLWWSSSQPLPHTPAGGGALLDAGLSFPRGGERGAVTGTDPSAGS